MIEIYTDGATMGYNGKLGTVEVCGIGFWVKQWDYGFSRKIKAISNNEAEFFAMIAAAKFCKINGITDVTFLSDSKIVVNRALGSRPSKLKWKNERMDYMQEVFLNIVSGLKYAVKWVPREKNSTADFLSRKSLYLKS